MLYCNKCREKNDWPTTGRVTAARCGACCLPAFCFNLPESLLPNAERRDELAKAIERTKKSARIRERIRSAFKRKQPQPIPTALAGRPGGTLAPRAYKALSAQRPKP